MGRRRGSGRVARQVPLVGGGEAGVAAGRTGAAMGMAAMARPACRRSRRPPTWSAGQPPLSRGRRGCNHRLGRVPFVSLDAAASIAPRRHSCDLTAEPVSTYPETPGVARADQDDGRLSPTRRGTDRRRRIDMDRSRRLRKPSCVRFAGTAPPDRLVGAMESFKAVMREAPGTTRVVIHVLPRRRPGAADGACRGSPSTGCSRVRDGS
jgi:hypothetical protein